ncbi:MAG: ferritin family protein [candidate division Zixibacteria bacterium]|nr:ferritin family protein [candidate division Zixibacteria bacterium]
MTTIKLSGKELLKRAIKGEQDGLRFYTYVEGKATNPEAKRKLKRLADDETRHEKTLREIFRTVYGEEVGELPAEGINALAKFLNTSGIDELKTEMQFIDLAIQAELSATNFYKENIPTAESAELKKLYQALADEEYRHFELLQAEKDALGGNYYWFGYDGSSPMEE